MNEAAWTIPACCRCRISILLAPLALLVAASPIQAQSPYMTSNRSADSIMIQPAIDSASSGDRDTIALCTHPETSDSNDMGEDNVPVLRYDNDDRGNLAVLITGYVVEQKDKPCDGAGDIDGGDWNRDGHNWLLTALRAMARADGADAAFQTPPPSRTSGTDVEKEEEEEEKGGITFTPGLRLQPGCKCNANLFIIPSYICVSRIVSTSAEVRYE